MAAVGEPHSSLYDTIVVGAGIQGSFTAYHLAKRGRETLLLEQFPLPHSRGSSHGQSRIIRRAYPQEHYAQMMAESYRLWEQLEAEAGAPLYRQTGLLVLGADTNPEFQRCCRTLVQHDIPGELFTAESLHGCFPGIQPHCGEAGVSDRTAGVLYADRALRAVQVPGWAWGARLLSGQEMGVPTASPPGPATPGAAPAWPQARPTATLATDTGWGSAGVPVPVGNAQCSAQRPGVLPRGARSCTALPGMSHPRHVPSAPSLQGQARVGPQHTAMPEPGLAPLLSPGTRGPLAGLRAPSCAARPLGQGPRPRLSQLPPQDRFRRCGGALRDGEKVTDIKPGVVVTVTTSGGVYQAKSLVITAGPWANKLLAPLGLQLPLQTLRINVCYWKEKVPGAYGVSANFPCFLAIRANQAPHHIYGLPANEYPGLVKICYHSGSPADPEERDRPPKASALPDIQILQDFVSKYLPGLVPEPAVVEHCMYTNTPDEDFVLDRHPKFSNIVIGAGFSGHGFKLAPVVGKLLCQLSVGEEPSYAMEPFRIRRFPALPAAAL
ncbi:mRNA cap guanine-N7 methyltransferase [Platysternon megacephalum]|uniref:Peroxisomal sarcosine oxidase n=1 Tax=Platysternon megacephalum TaxID=55544 RepID=A0A4D9DRD1_9SAUR|nr:mRNA cap guanine-N7 methyltransferase [Platysternon megacephalum]